MTRLHVSAQQPRTSLFQDRARASPWTPQLAIMLNPLVLRARKMGLETCGQGRASCAGAR